MTSSSPSPSRTPHPIFASPLEAATFLLIWESDLADGRITPQQLACMQPLVGALSGLAACCQAGIAPAPRAGWPATRHPTTRHPTVV
jgi:hypothetical protein